MLQSLTPLFMILAVLILSTDRRIVRALRDQGAYTPESAVPLPPRNAIWRWRLRRLVGHRAVVRVDHGNLVYLDDAAWQEYRSWRRRRALTILAIVIPLLLLLTWLASGTDWFSSDT